VNPVLHIKGNHDFGSAHFNQQLLEHLIVDGSYARHLDRLVGIYRRKRDVMLEALEQALGCVDGVSWTRPQGGIYVWLTVPSEVPTGPSGKLFSRCLERGVLYVPGEYAFAPEPGPVHTNCARLSYGVVSAEGLVEGIGRLAAALADCLDGRIEPAEANASGQRTPLMVPTR
jgi:2-aminoadipate transaminase